MTDLLNKVSPSSFEYGTGEHDKGKLHYFQTGSSGRDVGCGTYGQTVRISSSGGVQDP